MSNISHDHHNKKSLPGINAETLTVIACTLMLLDHLWGTVIPGNNWMTYVGRMAFPIFAFKISEGFFHTSDVNRYAKRLFVFALISEIPFNLMFSSGVIYPFHQNIFFTLLLGLLCIKEIHALTENFSPKKLLTSALKIAVLLTVSVFGFVDYGICGVFTIILFYVCRRYGLPKIFPLAGMIIINFFIYEGMSIPLYICGYEILFPVQGFAVFSLPVTWLYNGRKASHSKALQYGFYLFYPMHMLLLAILRNIL